MILIKFDRRCIVWATDRMCLHNRIRVYPQFFWWHQRISPDTKAKRKILKVFAWKLNKHHFLFKIGIILKMPCHSMLSGLTLFLIRKFEEMQSLKWNMYLYTFAL